MSALVASLARDERLAGEVTQAVLHALLRSGHYGVPAADERSSRSGLPRRLLGALDPADDFHRDLVATALAYLDHGQRLDRTADAVHLHPNTVRYRLRRLQELTGLPDHPTVPETVRWWWALRSWPPASPTHR